MKTFRGYELKSSSDAPGPTIWWDGKHIQSNSAKLLTYLKKAVIAYGTSREKPTLHFSDGEEFFDRLHLLYKNGYQWLDDVTVNEKGEKVG